MNAPDIIRQLVARFEEHRDAYRSGHSNPINFSDPADKRRHDQRVSLVERILALHKRSPRTPQEQEMVKREIEVTDRQIDRLVYELCGLTEEEIKIVEGG